MIQYYLAPSILAADFSELGKDIECVEKAGAKWLHIDVMDGVFVPNLSLGIPVVSSLRKKSGMLFDVHLMIESPVRYIEQFADAGADGITFHIEAVSDPVRVIERIRSFKINVGISLKPSTSISMIEPVLGEVDTVLVMTVEPGFGGQKLNEMMYDKVRDLRSLLDKKGLSDVNIEVDGGVNINNAKRLLDAGANVLVAGSAVFSGNTTENVRQFQEMLSERQAEKR